MEHDGASGPDAHRGASGTTAEMLSALVVSVASQLADMGWDSPALLLEVHLTPTSDLPAAVRARIDSQRDDAAGFTGPAWTLRAPTVLDGHPFDALIGRRVDPDAVGSVLVTEAWVNATEFTGGALAEDLGAHPGPDGRTEVRNVCLVLRDGTTAHAMAVRDGDIHLVGTPQGRVPSALRRTLGVGCGLDCDTPTGVAVRAWLHAALTVAAAVAADPAATTELGSAGTSPADATLVAAANDAALTSLLPPAFGWLITEVRADPTAGWDELLATMVLQPDLDVVRWLLVTGSASGWAHGECSSEVAAAALDWCDPDMFAYLFDAVVPDLTSIAEAFAATSVASGISFSFDALVKMAHDVAGRPHAQ